MTDVCDKDLGIDSVSSATCIQSNESVHQPNLSATVSTSACETNPESESSCNIVSLLAQNNQSLSTQNNFVVLRCICS